MALPTRAFGHPTRWTVRVISPRRAWVVHILREVPFPSLLLPASGKLGLHSNDKSFSVCKTHNTIYIYTSLTFLGLSSEVLFPLTEEGLWKLDSLRAGSKRNHLAQGKPSDRRDGLADSLQILTFFKAPFPHTTRSPQLGSRGAPGWHGQPRTVSDPH